MIFNQVIWEWFSSSWTRTNIWILIDFGKLTWSFWFNNCWSKWECLTSESQWESSMSDSQWESSMSESQWEFGLSLSNCELTKSAFYILTLSLLTFIFILNSCHQVRFQKIIPLVTKDFKILPRTLVQHINSVQCNTLKLSFYQRNYSERPGTRSCFEGLDITDAVNYTEF